MNPIPEEPDAHDHFVTVDIDQMTVVLKRIAGDSPAVLYTQIDLPTGDLSRDEMDCFCKKLGEAIVLDSAPLRKIFGL